MGISWDLPIFLMGSWDAQDGCNGMYVIYNMKKKYTVDFI